jgi:hypothetical protein
MATPYSAASSAVRSIREAVGVVEPERDVAGKLRSVGGQILRTPPDDRFRRRQRDQRLLELHRPRVQRPRELRLLTSDRAQDPVALLDEIRVGVGHHVDDHGRRVGHEWLTPAEEPPVPHRPPEDASQDVATALIAGKDVVRDQKRDGARVVGDDLIAEALLLERVGIVAEQVAHPSVDRREEVGVVVRRDALDDAGEPLQTHARVDARGGQRRQRPVGPQLELHEHEVPDLEPARARLAMVRDALRGLR